MTFRRLITGLVVTVALSTAVFASGGDWTTARYDEAQTGYTPEKLSLPLSMSWQYNGVKFDNNTSTPAVVNGMVYYASGDRVYAVNSRTGELKWRYPSTDGLSASIKTGITVWKDRLFFGATDGAIYALDTATGRREWTFTTQRSVHSTPAVANDTIYVGSNDNSVYALDAKTGVQVWTGPFRTHDDVNTPPALATGIVVFSSMDMHVYGANEASGRYRWSFQLPAAAIKGGPIVSGGLVIVGTGRSVYVLSSKNGQFRYKIDLESEVATPLALADNDLYVVCHNKKIYAFTVGLSGFTKKWDKPADVGVSMTAAPTVAGNAVFVGCSQGVVAAFSTTDGKMLWRYTIAPSIVGNNLRQTDFTNIAASPVVADEGLYVVTDDGALHCFRSDAPDQAAPRIFNVSPQSTAPMSGFPPLQLSALLWDETTGVDPNSIQFYIDTEKKDFTYDPKTLSVWYDLPFTQPVTKLTDGRHGITIVAKDWKGNELKYSWTIVIDNLLPQRPMPKSAKTTTLPGSSKKTTPSIPGMTGRMPSGGSPDTGPPLPPPPPVPGAPEPSVPGAPGIPGGR